MSQAFAGTTIIVNPAARGGAVGRNLPEVNARLQTVFPGARIERTTAPGTASAIARNAIDSGQQRIIAMGGDGTLSEIADGVLQSAAGKSIPELALLPAGTGGDFRRLLQADDSAEALAQRLQRGEGDVIDAGHITLRTDDGETLSRHFINIASFGIAGLVDRIVNTSSKRLGGRLSFLIGTLRAVSRYVPAGIQLRVDGVLFAETAINNIAVANGRFFGGGMQIAPSAQLNDGLLDVVVLPQESVPRGLRTLRRIYAGRHIDVAPVLFTRGRVIEATPTDQNLAYVDVDGEAPGFAPIRIEVRPRALRFVGLRRDVLVRDV